ncbi:MAG: tRNA (adenosine(37)-N6)-dimethylallyltransferase MiaA [Saprospiraceae bacterium]
MHQHKFLIVIGGPTASGKTTFAVQVAQHFNTEIISCDSRQFYKEMSIGTAKPTTEEMQGIPHHFIGHRSITEHYSVGDFEKEALELLYDLFHKCDIVVAVGGSGLYIKALCEGLDKFPDISEEVRHQVRQLYADQGLEGLQKAVQAVDPVYFTQVDRQNPHRLIRALEVSWGSGQPFSSFRQNVMKERFFTPIYIEMQLPREVLYDRINKRVDRMMENGLLDEVKKLYPQRNLTALQTVGYQELFNYLEGAWTLEEAVDKIKQNSRNYAKRQLTWWRRDGFWQEFAPDQVEAAIQWIELKMKALQT